MTKTLKAGRYELCFTSKSTSGSGRRSSRRRTFSKTVPSRFAIGGHLAALPSAHPVHAAGAIPTTAEASRRCAAGCLDRDSHILERNRTMAGITTHVLDSNRGRPVGGRAHRPVDDGGRAWKLVKTVRPMREGGPTARRPSRRTPRSASTSSTFHIDEYFKTQPRRRRGQPFVDKAVGPLRRLRREAALSRAAACTPGSCTTYRGS